MTPYVVVEGSESDFRHAVEELERDGWTIVRGWEGMTGTRTPRSTAFAAPVDDDRDAAAAVLAAVVGAGIVAWARADRDVIDRLCDDLRRLGPVDHRLERDDDPLVELDQEQRELLALLADGLTLGEAASRLHISRRTADRRIADAKRTLGVASTSEALTIVARSSPRPRR